MLTEDQHPHPLIQKALRQASWDLFFSCNPVHEAPDFVADPGMNLAEVLEDSKCLSLLPERRPRHGRRQSLRLPQRTRTQSFAPSARANQSWLNILKAIASMRGKPHERFGSVNVKASAKSVVRKMLRETGLSLEDLELAIRETQGLAGDFDADGRGSTV